MGATPPGGLSCQSRSQAAASPKKRVKMTSPRANVEKAIGRLRGSGDSSAGGPGVDGDGATAEGEPLVVTGHVVQGRFVMAVGGERGPVRPVGGVVFSPEFVQDAGEV